MAVIQDDTIACKNLLSALERIVSSRPNNIICLFLGGLPKNTAVKASHAFSRGHPFVDIAHHDFIPVVATLWPVEKAAAFLAWTAENPKRLRSMTMKSDDAIVTRWAKFAGEIVYATVPSLVQHPDDIKSTIGRQHYAGLDKGRVARHWIGDADPLEIDWSAKETPRRGARRQVAN